MAAANIVRLCQENHCWRSFNITDLIDFYDRERIDEPEAMFFGLMGSWIDDGGFISIRQAPPYLVVGSDGMYHVTDLFIKKCAGQKIVQTTPIQRQDENDW